MRLGSKPHDACLPGISHLAWPDLSQHYNSEEVTSRAQFDVYGSQPASQEPTAEPMLWTSRLLPFHQILQP